MAEDPQPLGDLKANVERALEQTRGVLNTYFNFIQRAISSYPSAGGTELGEKLKTYTNENIAAAREFADKLSQAKDFEDVVRIQTEFMEMQFKAFGEQTKSLGEAATKAATDAVKTLSKNS
jgi:hypothetical protein